MPDEYDIPIEPNPDILVGDHLTGEEKELLNEKVVPGSEVDSIPQIPDAPDISPAPKKSKVPGTFKNRIEGLQELKPDEIPVAGQHFVVWGSKLLDDIQPRPVRRAVHLTENDYASKMRDEAALLVAAGVKSPPGGLRYAKTREDRAEEYARWRYRGFVVGEVASL